VSGGPVYISDKPGNHSPALLRQLTLPGGRVPSPLRPALPAADCLLADVQKDGKTSLKIASVNAHSGVVAAFNVQGQYWDRDTRRFYTSQETAPQVTARLSPLDVHEFARLEEMRASSSSSSSSSAAATPSAAAALLATTATAAAAASSSHSHKASGSSGGSGGLYAAYVRGSGEVKVVTAGEGVEVALGRPDVAVATFAPLLALPSTSSSSHTAAEERGEGKKGGRKGAAGKDEVNKAGRAATGVSPAAAPSGPSVAVLGLRDLMNPGGAVEALELLPGACRVRLMGGGGTLLLYASQRPRGATAAAVPSSNPSTTPAINGSKKGGKAGSASAAAAATAALSSPLRVTYEEGTGRVEVQVPDRGGEEGSLDVIVNF
jgi:hypothetical protein